ncbi:hypothetical protein [Micromonospora sp. NPDC050200]|uniref:hypothetical protein n=1 Tax=Micromonospora sp. NPDC050200 TaxID=3155664 RepID=UPI0034019478
MRSARLLLTVLATSGALALAGCQVSVPVDGGTVITSASAHDSGLSALDDAGVVRIKDERRANFDMTGGSLRKSAVGLADGASAPSISTIGNGKIELNITAPHGTITALTDHISFFTTGDRPDITTVSYLLSTKDYEEYVALIRDGVQKYGLDSNAAENWIRSAADHTNAETGDAGFNIDGTSTGLRVNYEFRLRPGDTFQVILVTVSAL